MGVIGTLIHAEIPVLAAGHFIALRIHGSPCHVWHTRMEFCGPVILVLFLKCVDHFCQDPVPASKMIVVYIPLVVFGRCGRTTEMFRHILIRHIGGTMFDSLQLP